MSYWGIKVSVVLLSAGLLGVLVLLLALLVADSAPQFAREAVCAGDPSVMACLREWFGALGPFVIGVAAVVIAGMQWLESRRAVLVAGIPYLQKRREHANAVLAHMDIQRNFLRAYIAAAERCVAHKNANRTEAANQITTFFNIAKNLNVYFETRFSVFEVNVNNGADIYKIFTSYVDFSYGVEPKPDQTNFPTLADRRVLSDLVDALKNNPSTYLKYAEEASTKLRKLEKFRSQMLAIIERAQEKHDLALSFNEVRPL